MGSGGSGIPGASVLNNVVRDGAFKKYVIVPDSIWPQNKH